MDVSSPIFSAGITSCAVLKVKIIHPDTSRPPFAFVILFDETLTRTAQLFKGLEILGEEVFLRRPREYCAPPDGEPSRPTLDVSILYRIGMLKKTEKKAMERDPVKPSVPAMRGLRHLYIGNLPEGHKSLQDVTELVICLCSEMASYKQDLGPPMLDASEVNGGWLVEMQSPQLAMDAQNLLRQMVLAGQHLSVYLTFARCWCQDAMAGHGHRRALWVRYLATYALLSMSRINSNCICEVSHSSLGVRGFLFQLKSINVDQITLNLMFAGLVWASSTVLLDCVHPCGCRDWKI